MSDLSPEEQQSFESVANAIIRNSIQSVLCIDDEYSNPYEEDKSNLENSKALYEAFRNEDCSLDIYNYSNEEKWELKKNLLNGKDLLILDWQLRLKDFKPALSIIKYCIEEKNIPYICIYTSEPDLSSVYINLYMYILDQEKQAVEIKYIEIKNFFQDLIGTEETDDLFGKIHEFYRDSVINDIDYSKLLNEYIKSQFPDKKSEIFKSLCNYFNKTSSAYRYISIFHNEYNCEKINIIDKIVFHKEHNSIIIDNTIIQIINKSPNPENLYNLFIKNILKIENKFILLYNIEIRNIYKNNYNKIGLGLNKVNDISLFHYNKQEGFEKFLEFLQDIWKGDINNILNTAKISIVNTVTEVSSQYNELESENIVNELVKLNIFASLNTNKNRIDKRIRFGDIFRIDKNIDNQYQYLICITQQCDCIRPKKINNNFSFIIGKKDNIIESIESKIINKDYISFLYDNNEVICVKWKNKPISIYINDQRNDISLKIRCILSNKVHSLSYIASQKENFTQRLANHSFSDAMRVGIDFAKIESDNTICESCGQKKPE